jgi:site-specific recombinase XerD
LTKTGGTQLTDYELTVREFLAALRQAGRTAGTIEKYEYRLRTVGDWLAGRGVTAPDGITKRLLREWGAELQDSQLSPATVRHAIAVVRSFLAWCREEEVINEPLAGALKPPKARRRLQRTLSDAEITALISVCDPLTTKGKRDIAMILLLTDSGLRASELSGVQAPGVYFDQLLMDELVNFVVVVGKGGNEAPAWFGTETAKVIRTWLGVRQAMPGVGELFVSVGGNTPGCALTRFGIRDIVCEIGHRANIAGVTPHAFRRAFACLADEAGASSRKIQQWGRWSDIRLVERYTQALQAGRHFNRYSPVNHLLRRE